MSTQKKRSSWTKKEDQQLKSLVEQYQINKKIKWSEIAKEFKSNVHPRDARACRIRYQLKYDQQFNRKKLSTKEIEKMFNLTLIYKNSWLMIGKNLKNRSSDFIKNQFYAIVNKIYRRLIKITFKNNSSTQTQLKPLLISELLCRTEEDQTLPITNELRTKFRKLILDHLEIKLEDHLSQLEMKHIQEIGSQLYKLNDFNFIKQNNSAKNLDTEQEKPQSQLPTSQFQSSIQQNESFVPIAQQQSIQPYQSTSQFFLVSGGYQYQNIPSYM